MPAHLALGIKILLNPLGQRLPQLHAPLIERIDVPDRALGESDMLVVSDERPQGRGRDLLRKDGRGRSITQEHLVRDQLVAGALGFDLLGRLADHERFRLREVVRRKEFLMLVVFNRVVGFSGEDEVGGDQFGALVQELEEGVLAVGARLAEEDGAGRVFDVVA